MIYKGNRFLAIVLVLFFSACKKDEGFIKFKTDYTTSITLPPTTVLNLPITILTPEVQTNMQQQLENNDSRIDRVKTIKLLKMNMTIKNPPDETFTFLKSIRLFIAAPGIGETEIAYLDPVPDNTGRFIELNVFDKDLSSYLKQEKYTLKMNVVFDELVNDNVDIDIYTQFEITAGLFK